MSTKKTFQTFCLSFLLFISFSSTGISADNTPSKFYPTVYGEIEITEPILIELIDSPPMQRLKGVHQYGVGHYISDEEEYSRYDHSMGVFHLLRNHNCSLDEQIAGLLHDVSHTVFSHLGDHFFDYVAKEDSYQDKIHDAILKKSGIETILNKYQITTEKIHHKNKQFKGLEQDLPHLCADRIDYNLQGAYLRGWISQNEMMNLFNDLEFDGKSWSLSNEVLAEKLSNFSIHMTTACWSSIPNHLGNEWLSEALLRGIQMNMITLNDVYHGEDKALWELLFHSDDEVLQELFFKIQHVDELYTLAIEDENAQHIPMKFRGINPLIRTEEGLKELSKLNASFNEKFLIEKADAEKGWKITLGQPIHSPVSDARIGIIMDNEVLTL
ncbi:MAG: HD superfamily phosphohydrolase [Chlamydiales bacterium]|jgi:HD superfamily phosphohydrolase